VTFIKDVMKEMLISSTTSISDDSFASESLTTECVLSSNEISYSLKSLIDIKAADYSFIDEVITQIVCDQFKLIIKSSFNINLLIQLKYSISIFWLNSNTWFQHSDLIWYWSQVDTRFEFSTQLVKKSNMTSRELNIEIFPIFRLCIIFLHYLFGRKS